MELLDERAIYSRFRDINAELLDIENSIEDAEIEIEALKTERNGDKLRSELLKRKELLRRKSKLTDESFKLTGDLMMLKFERKEPKSDNPKKSTGSLLSRIFGY